MNDQLIGMANLLYLISTAEGGRVGLLEDVIITQAYRGCGFGRHLLQHVCAWAQQTGLQRISLLTDRTNETALRFYHTLGFDVSGMCVLRKYF
jgi:GNAT superfamily N-acetyltransferase